MAFTVSEELWFGEVSDEPAEKEAANSMAAIVGVAYGLRPYPASAMKLRRLSADPDYKPGDVAGVIEADPTLAPRVLRIANSAAFGLRHKCTSVSHAVRLLGGRAIGELASAIAVLEMFSDRAGPTASIRLHLLAVGALARHLGVILAQPPEDIFTCGLMHDLGKLLLLQVGARDYDRLLGRAEVERDVLHVYERKEYGYDHALVAGNVIKIWKIPDPVPKVVAWHHQAARAFRAGGAVARQVSLVRLADHLSYLLDSSVEATDQLIEKVAHDEAATFLGLSDKVLSSNWSDMFQVVQESRFI